MLPEYTLYLILFTLGHFSPFKVHWVLSGQACFSVFERAQFLLFRDIFSVCIHTINGLRIDLTQINVLLSVR